MPTLNRKALSDATELVARVVSDRYPDAVVYPSSSDMLLRASNEEQFVETVIGVDGASALSGPIRIPGSQINAIVKSMRSDTVELETTGQTLLLRGAGERFWIPQGGLASESNWPATDIHGMTVTASRLRTAIERCLPAIASDGGPFALHGLYFLVSNGQFKVIATDGTRCHQEHVGDGNSPDWSGPVSKRAAQLFRRVLTDEECTVSFGVNTLTIACGNKTAGAVTLSGRYPAVPDSSQPALCTFDLVADDAVSIVKQSLVVDGHSLWTVRGGLLSVTGEGSTGKIEINVPVPTDGEAELLINPKLLLPAVDVHSPADTLTIGIHGDRITVGNGPFRGIVMGAK